MACDINSLLCKISSYFVATAYTAAQYRRPVADCRIWYWTGKTTGYLTRWVMKNWKLIVLLFRQLFTSWGRPTLRYHADGMYAALITMSTYFRNATLPCICMMTIHPCTNILDSLHIVVLIRRKCSMFILTLKTGGNNTPSRTGQNLDAIAGNGILFTATYCVCAG